MKRKHLLLTLLLAVLVPWAAMGQSSITVTCFAPMQEFATGYTDGETKTSGEMHAVSNGGVQGWMKFDVSQIPDNAFIQAIDLYFHSSSNSNCWVKLTSAGELDPVTASASDLYSAITNDSPNYYTSDYVNGLGSPGEKHFTLSDAAIANLQTNGLTNNYFTLGFFEFESGDYYLYAYGYNSGDELKPYINVTYTTAPYIILNPTSAMILAGGTKTLTSTVYNVSGTPCITYSTSDASVATVSGSGTTATVTAVSEGTATITATLTYDNTEYTATCDITVADACQPTWTGSDYYINNFTVSCSGVTLLDNASSGTACTTTNYYSTKSITAEPGDELSCTITMSNETETFGFALWVDFDGDGLEPSDKRFGTLYYQTSPCTRTFTIPANTPAGEYWLRILGSYSSSEPLDPCGSYGSGEAEDYKLIVTNTTCPKPTGLAMVPNSLSSHGVSFSWNYQEGDMFDYSLLIGNVTDPGMVNWNFPTWFAGGDFPAWNNLQDDTDYTFWLRRKCDENTFSSPVCVSFHTPAICSFDVENLVVGTTPPVTLNSATLYWTGNAGVWEVAYKASYDSDYHYAYAGGEPSDFSFGLTNLDYGTRYEAKVRAWCDEDHQGPWSSSVYFTTECPEYGLPYAENFDSPTYGTDDNALPRCWNYINTCSYSYYKIYPKISEGDYHSPGNKLQFRSLAYYNSQLLLENDPQPQYAILPSLPNVSDLQMTLYARAQGVSSGQYHYDATFKVGVMTDPTDATTFTEVTTITPTATTYEQYTISFSDYSGTGTYIAIMIDAAAATGTPEQYDHFYRTVLIDDVRVVSMSNPVPENLAVSEITSNSAYMTWSAGGEETVWQVAYKKASDTDWTIESYLVDQAHYTLSLLDPNTEYQVKVRARIGDVLCESWTEPVSFSTACPTPFLEPFATNTLPAGWGNYYITMHEVLDDHASLSGDGTWRFGNEQVFGAYHATMNIWSAENHSWLVSPNIYIENGQSLNFDLALTHYDSSGAPNIVGDDDLFAVLISTDDGLTWNVLRQWDNTTQPSYGSITNLGESVVIDLSSYAGTGKSVRIAFYGESTVSNSDTDLHIDNVCIASCIAPRGPMCWNKTSHTASLAWTRGTENQTDWQVSYSTTANFDPEDGTMVDVHSTTQYSSVTLEYLEPNTTYYAYVRANCGSGDYSFWSDICEFTTEDICNAPEGFNIVEGSTTSSGATFEWDDEGDDFTIMAGTETFNVIRFYDFIDGQIPVDFTQGVPYGFVAANDGERYYIKSNNAGQNSTTAEISLVIHLDSEAKVGFDAKVSSESDNDKAYFSIDGVNMGLGLYNDIIGLSSEGEWYNYSFTLREGTHTLRWYYTKNGSVNSNDDCFYVSNIAIRRYCDWTVVNNHASSPYVINNLNPDTKYHVKAIRNCNGGEQSADSYEVVFTTLPLAVDAEHPYSDDFENAVDWVLTNGTVTNHWRIGQQATLENNNSKALYIAMNADGEYGYDIASPAVVYASKSFTLPLSVYDYSYDWRANGEYYPNSDECDYLRVALVPYATTLTASTDLPSGLSVNSLPEGWIPLDGGTQLNNNDNWTQKSGEVIVTPGYYKVVFIWRNDASGGRQLPAAIDNFSMSAASCQPISTDALPFTEGFEDMTGATWYITENNLTGCWDYYNASGDEAMNAYPGVYNSSNISHSGNNALFYYSLSTSTSPQDQYAILPRMEDVNQLRMSFYARTETGFTATIRVGVMSETDVTTFTTIRTFTASNDYQQYTVSFQGYTGSGNRIAIVMDAANSSNTQCGLYVDDISVELETKMFVVEGNWGTANNWDPVGVPTIEQNVTLCANVTIESGCEAEANVITQGSYTITIEDGAKLTHNNHIGNDIIGTVKKNIIGYSNYTGTGNGGYYLICNPLFEFIYSNNLGAVGLLNGNYDLYKWDYTKDQEWRNYKDNPFGLTKYYDGYLYANEQGTELQFYGRISASIDPEGKSVSYTSNTSNYDFANWNLLGNAYVCDAYLVDALTNGQALPYYKMNDDRDGLIAVADGSPIAPMEGFFYEATASGYVYIVRTAPVVQNNAKLNMNLSGNNKQLDNAIIRFDEGQTMSKFTFREGSSKVYIPVEGKDLAVAQAEGQVGEIPVSFKAEHNGSYTLSFTNEEVTFSYLHLIDNLTGNDVDLLQNPSYTFNAKTTDYESRFRLVFATGSSANSETDSFAFVNGMGNLCIFGIEGQATVQVIDMLGHVLSSETFSGSYEKRINGAAGVYVIRLVNGEKVRTQKVIVK